MAVFIVLKLGNLAVVNTKEFVNTGNHSFFAAFTLGPLLLDKLKYRFAIRLVLYIAH